jgi:hypothetical protein
VAFSRRVNAPAGPSGPSSATRTTSREPSATDSLPEQPLIELAINFMGSNVVTDCIVVNENIIVKFSAL